MVDISNKTSFEVGEWRVEPEANLLSRGGESVTIEPRVMELLVYLARHAGEVVSSEDIFDQVWPNVVVGENSLYRGIAQIRKVLGDSTAEPRYIATIPKRGYQLIANVTLVQPRLAARPEQKEEPIRAGAGKARPNPAASMALPIASIWIWTGAGVVVLVALALTFILGPDGDVPRADDVRGGGRLTSIAVLPFTNVSADPGNDYFALGLSDEILNTLGHVKGLDVVARTSSHAMERSEDVREIGRRLNVEGVVEGGVRKAGNRIRVNVQLIDAASGFDMWIGEYDRELDDVFKIQEEIAQSILEALSEQLEITLPKDPPPTGAADIEAYDLYLLGRHYVRARDPVELEKAVDLFRNAIWQDHDYPPAYSGLAEAYLLQAEYGDVSLERALQLAEPMLNQALVLDETLAEPYATRGLARFLERRHEEAQEALRTALELNPSHGMANMWLGLSLAYHQGQIKESQRLYDRGLSLDPLNVTLAMNTAYNLSRQGQYVEALERLHASSELHPGSFLIQLGIAQTAADAGKFDIAHRAAVRALELEPDSVRAMTMLAYTYANLGDIAAAEQWIARIDASGAETSHWHLNSAKAAVYLQKGEMPALVAFLERVIDGNFKPDPLLFFSPREWQPYGAAGLAQMLVGAYPVAAAYFDSYLRSVGEIRMTQTVEDSVFFLTNAAYVQREMGQQARFQDLLSEGLKATAQARRDGWDTNKLAFYEARLHALEGESEKALAVLEKAIDNGFHDLWLLQKDPVWAGFSDDDAFRRLTARMEQTRIELLRRINDTGEVTASRR